MKKVAIIYDFDKTLCTKDMEEYSLIPALGYKNAGEFWDEVTEVTLRNRMDPTSAYLYLLQKKFEEQNTPLTKEAFAGLGKDIVLYPGVESWFSRINAYGRKAGFLVQHYIISSGMAEILQGTSIADEFEHIYACRYYYDENKQARWPAQIVNFTTKTQYLFRINKGVLDESDNAGVNEYVDPKERPIPFTRMVYVADGMTDIPCMKLVKEYGGRSIAVYEKNDQIAKQLVEEDRVNFMSKADYSEGSDIEKLMKKIIDHMKADLALEEIEESYR